MLERRLIPTHNPGAMPRNGDGWAASCRVTMPIGRLLSVAVALRKAVAAICYALVALALWPSPAFSQASVTDDLQPVVVTDANGVDLSSGQWMGHQTATYIGDASDPIFHFLAGPSTSASPRPRTPRRGVIFEPNCGDLPSGNQCWVTRRVELGAYQENIKAKAGGWSSYRGEPLTIDAAGLYVLTLEDGTVARFDPALAAPEGPWASEHELAQLIDITRPNGETIKYVKQSGQTYPTFVATSSRGYLATLGVGVALRNRSKVYCDTATGDCAQNSYDWSGDNPIPAGYVDTTGHSAGVSCSSGANLTNQCNYTNAAGENLSFVGQTLIGAQPAPCVPLQWEPCIPSPVPSIQVTTSFTKGNATSYNYSFFDIGSSRQIISATATYANGETLNFRRDQGTSIYHIRSGSQPETTVSYLTKPNWFASFKAETSSDVAYMINPEGNRVDYEYDARRNRTKATYTPKPGSSLPVLVSTASYPAVCSNFKTCNKPEYVIDVAGNRTDFAYDPQHGGVISKTLPAGSNGVRPQTRYSYQQLSARYLDASNNLVADTPMWMLTSTSSCKTEASCAGTADETVTEYTYTDNLQVHTVTTRSGDNTISTTVTNSYDHMGNLIAVDGPMPGSADTTRYVHVNGSHTVHAVMSPDPDGAGPLGVQVVKTIYDGEDKPLTVTKGYASDQSDAALSGMTVTQVTDVAYDNSGRKVAETVSSGGAPVQVAQFNYDTVNRPVCTAVRMNPAVFGSLPDACTLSTAGSNGPDRITRNEYDAAGQLTKVTKAYGTTDQADDARYTYTANGKRATVTDANGNVATLTYDGFDRQSAWYFPNASGPGSSTTDFESYGYDANGNRTSLRKRDGTTINYAYDALNRMVRKDAPTSASGVAGYSVFYGYDLRGLQTYARFGSAEGEGVTNSYDGLGRMISSTTALAGTSRTVGAQYDADGNRTEVTTPRGTWTYTYDGVDRLSGLYEGAGTATVLSTWAYNAQGLPQSVAERYGSGASWSYDGLGRLSGQVDTFAGGAGNVTVGLQYNPAGQIVTRTRDNDAYAFTGAVTIDRSYGVNGLNQYTSAGAATFAYDANGNLTGDGTTSYVYDAENRLVSTSAGTSLRYDPLGRLFQVTGPSGPTQFLYDGDQLVAEFDGAGTLTNGYVHGPGDDDPLLWYPAGDDWVRWLHRDHQGSIVASANGPSGALVGTNGYDEYGIPNAANSGRFQYTGQAWVPELGMYHYKARIYSPTLGRFLQTDPIGYDDQINLYAYVANDPVNGRDPTGTECVARSNGGQTCTMIPAQKVPLWHLPAIAVAGAAAAVWNAGVHLYERATGTTEASASSSTRTDEEKSGPYVYRGLSPTDNPAKGLWAANPLSSASPAQHVNGKVDTPFISTTKSAEVATLKYGENGAVRIDLSKVVSQVIDVSSGIPGASPRVNAYAKRDQEVLVRGFIPPQAISPIN